MGRRVRSDAMPDTVWTGRLEFDVLSPSGCSLGLVEIVVKREDLEVRFADRNLAVLDRRALRHWLRNPSHPYSMDDVTWSARGRARLLALDQAPPSVIPPRIVSRLHAVV
jgi:hypothetical protein